MWLPVSNRRLLILEHWRQINVESTARDAKAGRAIVGTGIGNCLPGELGIGGDFALKESVHAVTAHGPNARRREQAALGGFLPLPAAALQAGGLNGWIDHTQPLDKAYSAAGQGILSG